MKTIATERLHIIDLDETLLNTSEMFSVFENIGAYAGAFGRQQFVDAKRQSLAEKGSFGITKFLGQIGLQEVEVDYLFNQFINIADPEKLLYADAQRYLSRLDKADQPRLIYTAGNKNWQTIKVKALQLGDTPTLATEGDDKGDVMASWRNGNVFNLQTDNGHDITFAEASFCDDSPQTFDGLPAAIHGYRILRHNAAIKNLENPAPNVQQVTTLDAVPVYS